MNEIQNVGKTAKLASRKLANISSDLRSKALENIANRLIDYSDDIIVENERDIKNALGKQLPESTIERLRLTKAKLQNIALDTSNVATLPDPVGEIIDDMVMPNGLYILRKRVPLGVIGVIYESRPNVTVDISALCLKSGNAVILRGGSESFCSNKILTRVIQESIGAIGIPEYAVQYINTRNRLAVSKMLKMDEYIDLMIPRGGQELVNLVSKKSVMPSITGGVGVCHTYVDQFAEINMAVNIVDNAKVQSPYVCNALDTVLIHSQIAKQYLPMMADKLTENKVVLKCDSEAINILQTKKNINVMPATNEDWNTEHLGLTLGVKIVKSLDEAIAHIAKYGTGHSDAIITDNHLNSDKFLDEVDASVVLVNASTRFNDGGQLGLGAEVAISTNKIHARGPMGLKELTSYKWIVSGNGHIRL